ncbi:MAG: uroporphyrinogen-III C-methyltransferase [Thermodesulfobacteriota bacterium]|jgi:uroporphyrinogen III methyltransferase/synthase|nr:uroporphyrinogen-III C-methyltransferase [Thermodesulfobacteriota bacterium]
MMKQGIVYLVGAGPGDPGLITLRGRDCLRRADAVVYDYLANPCLLEEARADVEKIYVGKERGRHHLPQEQINALLAELAQAGKTVVRLKGGDPYLFGRGGEEALFLHCAGVEFEVVPGVTAAFAAAAYAGIPLTHRDCTTTLGLVTGHEKPEKKMSSLDWGKIATGMGTLVFYMGMVNLSLIVRELIRNGRSPQTPVAIVRWASTTQQRTLTATLEDVEEKARAASIGPPAVIIVGEVVDLHQRLAWFENRPLFGRRVLSTRAAAQASGLRDLLEKCGAEVVSVPTIALAPPADWGPVDRELDRLAQTDLLILTSVNAVDFFFERLRSKGRDARALAGVTLVSVGPKTAEAFEPYGVKADLVAADYRAEGVVALLKGRGIQGRRVLYPHAELARTLIPDELRSLGAEVAAPVLYRTVVPQEGGETLRELLMNGSLDAVTFTASSTVDHFVTMVGEDAAQLLRGVVVASIGPLTSRTARKHGIEVTIEPRDSTLDAMVEALAQRFKPHPAPSARD